MFRRARNTSSLFSPIVEPLAEWSIDRAEVEIKEQYYRVFRQTFSRMDLVRLGECSLSSLPSPPPFRF